MIYDSSRQKDRNVREAWVTALAPYSGTKHVSVHDEGVVSMSVDYQGNLKIQRDLSNPRVYANGRIKPSFSKQNGADIYVMAGRYSEDPEEASRQALVNIDNRIRALKGMITKLSKRKEDLESALNGPLEDLPRLLSNHMTEKAAQSLARKRLST